MKTSTSNTESKTDSTTTTEAPKTSTGYETAKPVETPVEETHDDLGYEIEKKPVETPKVEEKKPKEEEKPVEKAATGYGKEDEKVVETPKVEEKKPEELTEEEKTKKEITDALKDLGDGYNKEEITKFALENKLTKEQLNAYVKFSKEKDDSLVKANEEARKAQRKSWKEELQKDPEFGGENFDKNVDRVEKVLQNYMVNTKKVLTEKGGMLPPYIMRDFLALAKALNPTTTLVTGEPATPKEEDGDFLDNMYS